MITINVNATVSVNVQLANTAEVADIHSKLDQLIGGQKAMSQTIDDLRAKLDAQSTALADFQSTMTEATQAIATEIKQVEDLVRSGGDNEAAILEATGRIGTANEGINSANDALKATVAALKADDPPAPPPPDGSILSDGK